MNDALQKRKQKATVFAGYLMGLMTMLAPMLKHCLFNIVCLLFSSYLTNTRFLLQRVTSFLPGEWCQNTRLSEMATLPEWFSNAENGCVNQRQNRCFVSTRSGDFLPFTALAAEQTQYKKLIPSEWKTSAYRLCMAITQPTSCKVVKIQPQIISVLAEDISASPTCQEFQATESSSGGLWLIAQGDW